MKSVIPGTNLSRCTDGVFARYQSIIEAGNGLSMSQVCGITGLESSTVQNWIKRGFVPHPVKKKYGSRHLARIMLISALREGMKLERVGQLLSYINGDTDDESDDIVTEEDLFDLFCAVTDVPDGADIKEHVGSVLSRLPELESSARQRLEKALTVMAYTYAACRYLDKAETVMKEIL